MLEHINPEGWAAPKGYANRVVGTGRMLFVAAQIGWNARCEFESDDFLDQFRQTLDNVVAIVRAGGGGPEAKPSSATSSRPVCAAVTLAGLARAARSSSPS
jgi:enamine deaminase RidA (YjgF/YER057c/UK114 family)